jgi:hypothetical protein
MLGFSLNNPEFDQKRSWLAPLYLLAFSNDLQLRQDAKAYSIEGNEITHKIEVSWNQVCGFSDAMLMVRSALFCNCHMNGV